MNILDKKIFLYGNKKIQEDFKFLFQELNIMQNNIFENNSNIKEKMGERFIVVCEKKNHTDFEEYAKKQNLQYGIDYLYIEDFFAYYNPIFLKRGNRKLAVWGTGNASSELWDFMNKLDISSEIDFFIDNAKNKDLFKGKNVVSPTEILEWKDIYIVVATYNYQREIYYQLEKYGCQSQKDYVHCTVVSRNYIELLKKVCFSERKYAGYCERPMGYCDVIGDNLYLCCPDFLPISVGSMRSESFMSSWNSYIARILRLSVINNTFAFCNKQYCDLFDFEEQKEEELSFRLNNRQKHLTYPNTLMVGVDYTCNLKCPSCREKVCVASSDEEKDIEQWAEDLLENVIPYVKRLWVAGNGEVLFSKIYRKMIDDDRCKRRGNISILSNGTLFDERNWRWLEKSYNSIEIVISMDGLKDETIERLRKGANANHIKKNLEYLGGLRKRGKIRKLFVNCVLQTQNVSEIYDLMEYCRKIGADKVQFLKLKDNGIYRDDKQFEKMSIFDQNDCLKKEFSFYFTKKVLQHPLADWFNNSKALQIERKPRLDKYDTL